jgi:hypothetical protein
MKVINAHLSPEVIKEVLRSMHDPANIRPVREKRL